MSAVRLAVVGAGIMGSNHARVATQSPDVDLVAVVDADVGRAAGAASTAGARAVSSVDEIDVEVDAAIVAVPTQHHLEVATTLAARGIHLLVEKPLALNIEQARVLSAACETAGVILAVGHIERFNAAVAELPKFLDQPIHIEASRISPYSPRIADGVIADLMIHDIDAVLSLAGPDVGILSAQGIAHCVKSESEDLATIVAQLDNGWTATFNTSRLGQSKTRMIEVTQHESVVRADLLRQDIVIERMSRHEYLSGTGSVYRQSSVTEMPFLESRGEPLALELAQFVSCVRGEATPRVTASDGIRALEAVGLFQRAIDTPLPVSIAEHTTTNLR